MGNQHKEFAKTMKKKRTVKSKSPADIRAACLVCLTLRNINAYKTVINNKLQNKNQLNTIKLNKISCTCT